MANAIVKLMGSASRRSNGRTKLRPTVGYQLKNFFFDRERVLKQLDKKRVRAMSKIGSFIRRKGRNLTRARKSTSAPGKPPHTKTKEEPNLRTIFFGLEPGNKTLVVGPVRTHTAYSVPALMEHGGTVDLPNGQRKKFPPRPYMGPALEKEVRNPKLMQAWEDTK